MQHLALGSFNPGAATVAQHEDAVASVSLPKNIHSAPAFGTICRHLAHFTPRMRACVVF